MYTREEIKYKTIYTSRAIAFKFTGFLLQFTVCVNDVFIGSFFI